MMNFFFFSVSVFDFSCLCQIYLQIQLLACLGFWFAPCVGVDVGGIGKTNGNHITMDQISCAHLHTNYFILTIIMHETQRAPAQRTLAIREDGAHDRTRPLNTNNTAQKKENKDESGRPVERNKVKNSKTNRVWRRVLGGGVCWSSAYTKEPLEKPARRHVTSPAKHPQLPYLSVT